MEYRLDYTTIYYNIIYYVIQFNANAGARRLCAPVHHTVRCTHWFPIFARGLVFSCGARVCAHCASRRCPVAPPPVAPVVPAYI